MADAGKSKARLDAAEIADANSPVEWSVVEESWRKAVPGDDEKKSEAIDALKQFWKLRVGSFPKPKDRIRKIVWQNIAREAIIDHLANKTGLQLKLTSSRKYIFCRIRAPIKLLEIQADNFNYPLQLRGEIDPGSDFWGQEFEGELVEIEEEKKLYPLEEARDILERLYRAGKISAVDLSINAQEETIDIWSRRIHALERIADKVPVSNKFIACATLLSDKPYTRYVFQQYPSVRGMTLFRSKDRLYLTKATLDDNFDLGIMEQVDVVATFMALHDANRGEKLTVQSLAKRWVTFWSGSAKDVGAPYVTHDAYDENAEVWFFERPFAQPLSDIREYFGEKVAIYYAWMGHFTYFLTIPAALGIAIEIYYLIRGYQIAESRDGLDYSAYVYIFLVLTWSVVYVQMWKRECKAVALKWGTRGFETEEKDRPQFIGDSAQPFKRSPITNQRETYFPESKRAARTFFSYIVIIMLIALDLIVFLCIFFAQFIALQLFPSWYDWQFTLLISLIIAMTMNLTSSLYLMVATGLNDWENHRTDTDYEDMLVTKVITFELFNSFAVCGFVALGKGLVFGTCYINCIVDLRTLLYAILVIRVIRSVAIVFQTWIESFFAPLTDEPQQIDEYQNLMGDNEDDTQFLVEIKRTKYPGTFHDSASVFVQFSFINLFSVIVPVLAITSMLENLVKIRVDAYKLCNIYRRPHVEQAEDAGFWSETVDVMIFAGIYMNTALVTLSFPDTENYSVFWKVIAFLFFSQVLVLYTLFLRSCFSSLSEDPDYIDDIVARHEFLIDKYVKGYEDAGADAEAMGLFTDNKGNIDDRIDIDAMKLYDLRKGIKFSDEMYEKIEKLETRRRELQQELKLIKNRLRDVYATENFNDATGVGETKHGLPLGRLSVKLVEIRNFPVELTKRPGFDFKIRIVIKGTKVGAMAPISGLTPTLTDSQIFKMPNAPAANVVVNQSLGPYAPIRTIDAEVNFNMIVLLKDRPNNDSPEATCSVPLRELHDQEQHNIVLKWKIRDVYGKLQPTESTISVNLIFQYSKIVPLRNSIYVIQDRLRSVEKELTQIKSGYYRSKPSAEDELKQKLVESDK